MYFVLHVCILLFESLNYCIDPASNTQKIAIITTHFGTECVNITRSGWTASAHSHTFNDSDHHYNSVLDGVVGQSYPIFGSGADTANHWLQIDFGQVEVCELAFLVYAVYTDQKGLCLR